MEKVAAVGLVAVALLNTAAYAHPPFGLSWSSTPDQIAQEGVAMSHNTSTHGVHVYGARKLPSGTSNAGSYSMFFGDRDGLHRVMMISKPISGDATGEIGRHQYDLMKISLTRQHGVPVHVAELAGVTYDIDPEEFYSCLSLRGCGSWTTIFRGDDPGEYIQLSLNGTSMDRGYISISYESPDWEAVAYGMR